MIKRPVSYLFLVFAIFASGCSKSANSEEPDQAKIYEGIEFKMTEVQEPVIPGNVVNIKDFGAVSDGQVLNTQAFADAIEAVTEKGGGRVVIPAGIWLTGPIVLKSNLELFTESGALVLFSPDKSLYPLVETSFEGLNTWRCISPIYGEGLENVALTGHGIWDGSGDAWRFVKKSKLTSSQWKALVASGGVVNDEGDEWYPSEQFKKAHESADMNVPLNLKTKEEFEAIHDFLRPVMVSIRNSKRILIEGPTFQNSPAWCIHPLIVEDLIVRNITVRNPWYSQNGDGIDIESCKNVLVLNSNFDVGDDAICIKSGKDEHGWLRGIPTENVVIKNNIVYHGHGGVTVGSEMSGGVKNIHVSNCTFMGTDVGLRFKSNRGRGGIVEKIYISDVRMTDIPTIAISFNLYYGGQSVSEMLAAGGPDVVNKKEPVSEKTPQFKDISISNIILKGALQAVLLQGLPEMNLENVKLNDMVLEAENGFSVFDANGVTINNVKLKTETEKAVEIYNSKNIEVNGLKYQFASPSAITINGKECKNIKLVSPSGNNLKDFTEVGKEVPANEIKF